MQGNGSFSSAAINPIFAQIDTNLYKGMKQSLLWYMLCMNTFGNIQNRCKRNEEQREEQVGYQTLEQLVQLIKAALAFSVQSPVLSFPFHSLSSLFPTFPQISSAMIRSCFVFRPPTCSEVQVVQAKVASSNCPFWPQTNNHDWPQNYAANPSLTLPRAPGTAEHLQTLVHNLKLHLKES